MLNRWQKIFNPTLKVLIWYWKSQGAFTSRNLALSTSRTTCGLQQQQSSSSHSFDPYYNYDFEVYIFKVFFLSMIYWISSFIKNKKKFKKIKKIYIKKLKSKKIKKETVKSWNTYGIKASTLKQTNKKAK